MDHASGSGMGSSSESEFSISGSDNEAAETVEDSSYNKEKVNVGVNEVLTSVDCASEENAVSKASESPKQCDPCCSMPDSKFVPTVDRSPISKTTESSQLEPEVGMVFHSEDEAFEFYNSYAKKVGFSVRKGHLSKRKDGSVRVRIFLCSNEGLRQKHGSITRKPRFNERTNCKARIEFKVDRDNIWVVKKVILEHNHPLICPNQAYKLRSHRKIWRAQTFAFLAEEAHGTEFYTKRMRDLEKGDAQVLLDFLKERQAEDPSFFYAIQLDEKGQLTNFFWADGRSVVDFAYFGDVVLLETTYRTNKFGIPFAPLIGVNHHKQPIVFGAALLLDETLESFIWLFRTFMVAMSGRQPKTIFTEQFDVVSEAIKETLPDACHHFCLWHILKNSVKHLSHAYGKDPNFQKEFKERIYDGSSQEDFQNSWNNFINRYDLASNSWLQELYAVRERWALTYHGNSFCATMLTMQWSDSMDNLFRKYFDRKLPISKFLERYHKALARFREKELFEDYKSRQNKSVIFSNVSMLDEAAESYTRLLYADFEDELRNQFACIFEPIAMDGMTYTFKISSPKHNSYGLVDFNPSNVIVTCSCQKFERMGILCMHALKVLNNNNILHLPSQYVLKRWTKYAKDGVITCGHQSVVESDVQESLKLHYARVCHKAITIAVKSAVSSDALDFFERGLDNLTMEVENLLHNAPHDIERGRRKGRLKGVHERKRKKAQGTSISTSVGHSHDPSHTKGQANDSSLQMMINEPSSISPYPQDNAASYYNAIPLQSSGVSGFTSFPPETVIPTQELFTPTQGIYDSAIASQRASNSTIGRGNGPGSVGVSVPVVQGQANNFNNWEVQPYSVPDVVASQHHLDQPMHSTIPSQQQQLPGKLNLDINKGN